MVDGERARARKAYDSTDVRGAGLSGRGRGRARLSTDAVLGRGEKERRDQH
jgi:hypothetical protein